MGLATTNPVTHSDLPKVRKRIGMALLPAEQDRLTQCATGPWCLPAVRHTHASLLLEEGAGLATISERMGHSSVRTTADIYSHAIRGKDREVAEMWDKIMQPAREASKCKVVN